MKINNPNARIVALDVGEKRIGVASANVVARLASPLTTLQVHADTFPEIASLLARETACAIVVGLPRGMQGQETKQTDVIRTFVEDLKKVTTLPIYMQDESLTSVHSEQALQARKGSFKKEEVDALAATYILEDFLATNQINGVQE